ncbi:hypothetical protein VMCG_05031 [Cytospora schulzeri]|uniref:PHD-type domain-containing protein n=1 Tax=Cytospora schulzeri TaxID=448051 RepID=A0A423WMM7_9PEZI|nr:hypothetical protein VMCG_05031 [Valsa malicola]
MADHSAGTGAPASSEKPTPAPRNGFSPATQMILKRMRGESGGLSSALASATAPGAPRPSFPRPTYESVRERIIASMASGSTIPAPASPSSSSPSTAATLTLPLKPGGGSTTTTGTTPDRRFSTVVSGQKRKRGGGDDDRGNASDDVSSSPAEASDYGEGIRKGTPNRTAAASSRAAPTMTKSGRQILKPDTYDPAAAEREARKSAKLVKRTAEQALCKKCTRMHSPASNQMVFCDGCNDPWHQRCHDPWIGDEIIKDQNVHWYCMVCQAKRERLQPKRKVELPRFGSWAGKPTAQSLFSGASSEGLFSRAEANPTGPLNFIRKIPANAKKSTLAKARSGTGSLQSKAAAQARAAATTASSSSSGNQVYDEDEASFTRLWPRPGKGMYGRLPPEADDDRGLTDGNDYDAFSVIVFNEKGKKIEENGVKV